MSNNLFNRFGQSNNYQQHSVGNNIFAQLIWLKNNPGAILDIMLQNEKIDYRQYNELQQYKNNPEMICKYLINNGKANEISQAEHTANQINGK